MQRQQEVAEQEKLNPTVVAIDEEAEKPIVHDNNEWGIELVADDEPVATEEPQKLQKLAEGIEYAYMRSDEVKPVVKQEDTVQQEAESKNLEDLMKELNQL